MMNDGIQKSQQHPKCDAYPPASNTHVEMVHNWVGYEESIFDLLSNAKGEEGDR